MTDSGGYSPVEDPRAPISTQPQATTSLPHEEYVYNPRPKGQWVNGLCDCFKNLYPSCFCACFCCYGYYLLAQSKYHLLLHINDLMKTLVSEKTGFMSFRTIIYFGLAVYTFCLILQIIFPPVSVLGWITFIVTVIFAIALRWHIVKKENINSNFLTECCTGLFCHWCSVAQMARHIYGYTKVLDGDGDIDRPDQYIHGDDFA